MAAIAPISCKSGVVLLSSFHFLGEAWSANLEIENDEYKHFEMSADANGLIWSQVITSFSKGTATIRAKYNNTVGQRPMPDWAGQTWLDGGGTGYLGFTSNVGLVISYRVLTVRPATDTNSPGSVMWDIDIRITACLFTTIGP